MNYLSFYKSYDPKFYKSLQLYFVLILLLIIVIYFIFSNIMDISMARRHAAMENQQKNEWLEKYDKASVEATLQQIPKPILQKNVKDKQGEITQKIENLGLIIEEVKNPAVKNSDKKNIIYAESSLKIRGAWPNIVQCLESLEKDSALITINKTSIETLKDTSELSLLLTYGIYYTTGVQETVIIQQ